ncbi:hypothetical protein L1889_08185 [Paenalcaligenes niemegkensis]|uniref:hypothetical protein n=1 Tax=Paenalcaligenes niemegkensis TaxID=2895469 RepID=UPI001EE80C77|nr:hypothetical protein [Paenalcaligenes niemegkensis]MCQ9616692.1 hypothetical protein [Paenalcaligenes niemegkensis]
MTKKSKPAKKKPAASTPPTGVSWPAPQKGFSARERFVDRKTIGRGSARGR